MDFFKLIKKFLIFTLKEIYSFFLKLSLLILFIFILGVSLVSFIATNEKNNNETKIKNYSYVLFNPSEVTEDKIISPSIFSNIAGSNKYNISFTDILNSLDDIKNNEKIKGIIINLDQINISSSKTEEILKKFEEIKTKGKKIYAYGAYIQNSNYTIASAADEIISIPSSSAEISITGYHYSDLYFKSLFDKLGINMEIIRMGDFKSYGENYNSDTMSSELKEELTRILDTRYNHFIDNISKNRKINKETLNNDIINGNNINLTPFNARDKNFVDKLEYFDDFLKRLSITNENIIDIYEYYSNNESKITENIENKSNSNGTIAVIYAEGSILYNNVNDNSISINPNNIATKLEEAIKIPNLKGIVLRVNSPGGSALASEIIYQSLSKINIPVYVSMSETAASGGYYISMAGNKVFANNSTITGSIGVVSMFPKVSNTQKKYGISSNSISKGKYSDTYDVFTPLANDTKNKIVESMTGTYKEFKSRVSENRKIPDSVLENYAQGKIWLGEEALNIKLVDGIASLDETIKILSKDLNLGDNYNVKSIYSKMDFSETFKFLSSYILEKVNITSTWSVIYNKTNIVEDYKLLESNKNKAMYYLPYKLDIY